MKGKLLVILHGHIKSPPMGVRARRKTGFLLGRLQRGEVLRMPQARRMPTIGPGVSELRIQDHQKKTAWRILYRVDTDMVVVIEAFEKKTGKTPQRVIDVCKERLARLDQA